MKENQNIEFKETWRDEWLEWFCGFANSEGGTMYIGKKDKGEVKGITNAKELSELIPQKTKNLLGILVVVNTLVDDGKEYLEIKVEKYPFPISYRGKYYLRSGATNNEVTGQELNKFMLEKVGKTWDGCPYPNVSVENLDKEAIETFREKALNSDRLTKKDLAISDKTLLERLQLYENGYLTTAAILLFHENPEYYFTGATVKIGYFAENNADLRYQEEIGGPLILQVDKVIDSLKLKFFKALIWYDGIYRKEEYMFPMEAFREILLNAVNHKDYSRGIPIQVSVYEDKIYVANDGTFPKEIDITKIYEKHRSIPFNPKIAGTFFKSGMIESWGRGFEKIKDECKKKNVPLPVINVKGNGIMIECFPSNRYIELLNKKNTPQDTPQDTPQVELSEENLLNYLATPKSTKEILDFFGYSDVKHFRKTYLKPLIDKGKVELSDPDKPTSKKQKYISKI